MCGMYETLHELEEAMRKEVWNAHLLFVKKLLFVKLLYSESNWSSHSSFLIKKGTFLVMFLKDRLCHDRMVSLPHLHVCLFTCIK